MSPTIWVINSWTRELIKQGQGGSPASRRVVDFDTDTRDALKAWKVAQLEEKLRVGTAWAGGSWLFTNEIGEHYHPEYVGKRFRKLCAGLDLPRITMRQLRHSHATALLAAGTNPKVVQERLGHSSIKVTMDIYASVLPTMQREAVEKLAEMMCQVSVPARHFGSGTSTTLSRGFTTRR